MNLKRQFIERWTGRGRERSESQPFWLSLLREVYGVENPEDYIRFEEPVQLSHKSFIDGFIDATHVMIEQKSLDKDLTEPIKQSDGTYLTPYQQAKRYAAELPYSKRPRWIIACNFKEFHIYDMENPQAEPEVILLKDLDKEYYRLNFLVDKADNNIKRELELSIKAGEIVGKLYNALRRQYINPDSDESLKSLNKLCVRLVFCLYAESAGIFHKHKIFKEYLNHFRGHNVRLALMELFKVLNQPEEQRDPYLDEKLKVFPYVNGGLFDEDNIEIPNLTDEILDLLLEEASSSFDWSGISPTIFGAVFESTLNPVTRRSGGMHYTSIENIHKVIDPLFLDGLKSELQNIIKTSKNFKSKVKNLLKLQQKISSLVFLDPACGSGNFLTETYLSLRRLENEILQEIIGAQITLGDISNPIKVSISQFYGIEINDFAATVAKTALWIAESQMMSETAKIVHKDLDFLPLKTYTNIIEGNALQIDWSSVAPKVNYIMGNPPFVGTKYQTDKQKSDILSLCKGLKSLDYVTGWYYKAAEFMKNTQIRAAFVSTNSITQGEQVAPLWKNLQDVHINFAYRTFKWNSESNNKAQVHVVIIGFSCLQNDKPKIIFSDNKPQIATNINGYLIDAPNILIEKRNKPICNVPIMIKGSQPTDGGNLLLTEEERNKLLQKRPNLSEYIKRYMGADDLINNKIRYCLWLKHCPPHLMNTSEIIQRLEAVKKCRLNSKKESTQKWAKFPYLFTEDRQPNSDYIILPVVSSERRKYMPMAYVTKNVIANANAQMIPNGDLYTFGILNSNVHNAWLRAICGRMKSDYAYSATIVYNNFIWCTPSDKQKCAIEVTAQKILDARNLYPDATLADLYNDTLMPPELRKAHQANDRAVMNAYGFDIKTTTEASCVAELMKMYLAKTK